MKKTMTFTKEQIALYISIALHLITGTFYPVFGGLLLSMIDLPESVAIFITVIWAIVDLVLVYRAVASMASKKTK